MRVRFRQRSILDMTPQHPPLFLFTPLPNRHTLPSRPHSPILPFHPFHPFLLLLVAIIVIVIVVVVVVVVVFTIVVVVVVVVVVVLVVVVVILPKGQVTGNGLRASSCVDLGGRRRGSGGVGHVLRGSVLPGAIGRILRVGGILLRRGIGGGWGRVRVSVRVSVRVASGGGKGGGKGGGGGESR